MDRCVSGGEALVEKEELNWGGEGAYSFLVAGRLVKAGEVAGDGRREMG